MSDWLLVPDAAEMPVFKPSPACLCLCLLLCLCLCVGAEVCIGGSTCEEKRNPFLQPDRGNRGEVMSGWREEESASLPLFLSLLNVPSLS